MSWNAIYHPDVPSVDLARIPKNMQARIRKAIEARLLQNPFASGEPLRKSLKGHRKLRVGDYRVIYRVQGSDEFILIVGHRRDVYEKVFSRQ